MTKRNVPVYNGTLRNHSIRLPHCIRECSGIRIFGMRIKSIAFTTDVAIIKNINADAIIAVYPFTPQPAISQAVIASAVGSQAETALSGWRLRRKIRELSGSSSMRRFPMKSFPASRRWSTSL